MFDTILIANRGEIACRVIRTARRLGIRSVAVYSDADRGALHVDLADESVHIGAAPSTESYLRGERIIAACHETGAQAIHPGYGFLSESAVFASQVAQAGLTFIGPPPAAITAMGDKISSKKLARDAGVNVIPGFDGVIRDAAHAVEVAQEIGFPVMLKASAGGGGKGMRIAYDPASCADGFERASSEARASFGDDRVFIEKFIERPRHIEIQLLCDVHGNDIYLGERECSLQRRHQKVIEEAPSPIVDADLRTRMGEQAVALAKACNYHSAGTVEFVVDADRHFYFLEMNTRLQVEHPVTEFVTGLDLVEEMIRVAAGEPLRISQDEVRLDGWAIEARVYAEDPGRGFLPSIGRLSRFSPPPEDAHVRVDTGVYEGGEVSMHYDPMVAKLVAHGVDRKSAIGHLCRALDRFHVRGIQTNLLFLAHLAHDADFAAGEMTTGFIGERFPERFTPPTESPAGVWLWAAAAGIADYLLRERSHSLEGRSEVGPGPVQGGVRVLRMSESQEPLIVRRVNSGFEVVYDDCVHALACDWRIGTHVMRICSADDEYDVGIEEVGRRFLLHHAGARETATVLSPREAELYVHMPEPVPPDTSKRLLSPMPGLLVSLLVKPGDAVVAGQPLAVLEAMKMENTLQAERDAVVAKLMVAEGTSLAVDGAILEFE